MYDAILKEILSLSLDDRRRLLEAIDRSLPQETGKGIGGTPEFGTHGKFWLSQDFNDPLPDDFWFGYGSDVLNR